MGKWLEVGDRLIQLAHVVYVRILRDVTQIGLTGGHVETITDPDARKAIADQVKGDGNAKSNGESY